jgi:hypothetical protein
MKDVIDDCPRKSGREPKRFIFSTEAHEAFSCAFD